VDLDFDAIEKVSDYVTVPAGTYLCEIAEVRESTTKNGDERWGLRLIVAEGEFCGRQAAWDSLIFSSRGQVRVRLVLEALGMPTKGRVSLRPEDMKGRRAFVEVRPSEFEHPDTGQVVRRNEVPYRGYRAIEAGLQEDGQVAEQVPEQVVQKGGDESQADSGAGEPEDELPF
jgi:hypothetical protein